MRDGHLDAHAPEVAPADVATGLHAAGLSCAEAARRLASIGPNTTPDEQRSAVRRLVHKFVAPVPCLLEVAIILQLVLHEYFEAAVIAVLLVFNAVLGFVQEGRAQATIAALKSRLALVSSVRRDGRWITVPAADVVPGDVIKLVLGGIVAADVRVCDGMVLLDQSMLTGESLPVEATEGALAWAGALVRRGEAMAEVVATGARTRFGRTAELVRTAHAVSSQQQAVFRVVVAIAAINGAAALALIGYALATRMPAAEVIPLALIAVLASVPVALPATFTLAGALGAQALARKGVIPTRLSAVDEAATMDLLCVDKTGTLTRNVLAVTAVVPMPGFSVEAVLARARLASADAGPDPLDAAIRAEIDTHVVDGAWSLVSFTPFDPATKRAEATARRADGDVVRIAKGAFAHILAMADARPDAEAQAVALERKGLRVLGVATNETGHMTLTGLLAFSDPPRRDTAACVTRLRELGLAIVMVTGDAAVTADVIARQVGLDGAVAPADAIATGVHLADYTVFAGVLPADKHALVKAFQAAGRTVGMCGDGANDAPALRQAQIGIAVSTATDVARSAAGLVLTEPGLSGILDAVIAGRLAFQRILTYTLRSIIHKVRQVLS